MTPISRRQSLRMSLAALAAAVTTPARAASGPNPTTPTATACIVLYMHGGASHIDTFDPKPGTDVGGPFAAIPTAVSGMRISEHLPGLASRAQRLSVVRSVTAAEGNHDRARYLMHTGYAPAGQTRHPSLGSMLAQARSGAEQGGELPGYIAINGSGQSAGLLGARHGPFVIANPLKPVRYLAQDDRLPSARLDARAALWRGQQSQFAQTHRGPVVQGHTEVVDQALRMLAGGALGALDITGESEATRARYGEDRFGQGCLLARRLVNAGVPFVEVGMKGWDTHEDNFTRVQSLSAKLDAAMSALLDDLAADGRLANTLVVWMGDFGRSPKINARGGRDHHPRASSIVVAGGPLSHGQVIGATDARGGSVTADPVTVSDLMRTLATAMGLDPTVTRMSPQGRPLTAVDGGRIIPGLGLA